jgi:hypothetical protein
VAKDLVSKASFALFGRGNVIGAGGIKGRPQETKVTAGTSQLPFAKRAPSGGQMRKQTGERSGVNRDSIKGMSQTPAGRFKPSGSAKKKAAQRAARAAQPNSPGSY